MTRSLNLHEKDSWRMWSLPSTRNDSIRFDALDDDHVGFQVWDIIMLDRCNIAGCWNYCLREDNQEFGEREGKTEFGTERNRFQCVQSVGTAVWGMFPGPFGVCWNFLRHILPNLPKSSCHTFSHSVFLGPIWCFKNSFWEGMGKILVANVTHFWWPSKSSFRMLKGFKASTNPMTRWICLKTLMSFSWVFLTFSFPTYIYIWMLRSKRSTQPFWNWRRCHIWIPALDA